MKLDGGEAVHCLQGGRTSDILSKAWQPSSRLLRRHLCSSYSHLSSAHVFTYADDDLLCNTDPFKHAWTAENEIFAGTGLLTKAKYVRFLISAKVFLISLNSPLVWLLILVFQEWNTQSFFNVCVQEMNSDFPRTRLWNRSCEESVGTSPTVAGNLMLGTVTVHLKVHAVRTLCTTHSQHLQVLPAKTF